MRSALFCVTDVSGQPIGSIFKRQKIQVENFIRFLDREEKEIVLYFLTLEDGNDRLSRNVGKTYTTIRCVITQKSADLKKNVLDQLSDHQGP